MESAVGGLAESFWIQDAASPLAMTPSGSRVYYLEHDFFSCAYGSDRLVSMRTDGTGYEVLLDYHDVVELQFGTSTTRILNLAVSGDGKTLAALVPQFIYPWCGVEFPTHVWLIDTGVGAVAELAPNWPGGVHSVGFSDDGDRIVYVAVETSSSSLFTARRTTTTAYDTDTELVFGSGELGVGYFPVISGNGKVIVFTAHQGFTASDPQYLYVYQVDSGRLAKIIDSPVFHIASLGVSFGGDRVIYGKYTVGYTTEPLYGVSGNGSDLHVLTPSHLYGSATLSRDGKWVYFTDFDDQFQPKSYRVSWEGGDREFVGDPYAGEMTGSARYGLSAQGDLVALRRNWLTLQHPQPLVLVKFGSAWLTTYGLEAPGKPLRCDVGAAAGAPFTLFGSLFEGKKRTQFGLLCLEQSRVTVLAQGVVSDASNVATIEFQVPDDPVLLNVDYYFQALVGGASALGEPALTNSTHVTFGAVP